MNIDAAKNKYEAVIGLEVHIQAKTNTKMFSAVSADYFGKAPNVNVDPVSLGLPGALPVPNKKAIEHCIALGMALSCEISRSTKFDRKNYFYPDLPKGYQISQYDQPICLPGKMDLYLQGGVQTIGITRIHLEEDTGKSVHKGSSTYLDFNKAGVPLIEVVTEPDFRNGEQIDYFAKRLRQIVRYLGVCDGDMEKGQMRYELNISLRLKGQTELPKYKVEVKNIGSISLLQKVLETEFERQAEILESGEIPKQETRGARDMTGKTSSQRSKETADDYRYFPEPDIPPLEFSEQFLQGIRSSMPALPQELLLKYIGLGITQEMAEVIIAEADRARQFESYLQVLGSEPELALEIAKYLVGMSDTTSNLDDNISSVNKTSYLPAEALSASIQLKLSGKVNSSNFKKLLENTELRNADDVNEYAAAQGLLIDNQIDIKAIASELIAAENGVKERYAKNPGVAMFFVGQIMKQTKGAVEPQAVKAAVIELLES